MNESRLVCLSGLLLCLLVGGSLRLTGHDWGYEREAGAPWDANPGYTHPDERSVYGKAGGLGWDPVERLEGESFLDHQWRAFKLRFLTQSSKLNINSFNYGTFPYYTLVFLSWLGNSFSPWAVRFYLLGLFITLLAIRWAVKLALALSDPERKPRLGRFLLELGGALLLYAILFHLCGKLFLAGQVDSGRRTWHYGSWAMLGRPLSAIAGTLTILYAYRIGARVYSRRVGLLAAIFLTFTVLHIQLSHYFTFDVILAFFTTASVYSLLVFLDAQTWGQRWRAMAAASVWFGLGLATKFGAILLFIPWAGALGMAFWKQRPHVPFFSLKTCAFGVHLKVLGIASFALIWLSAFLGQPFGFLDFPSERRGARATEQTLADWEAPTLSFVHLDLGPPRGETPGAIRSALLRFTDWLDRFTGPLGFHFGAHMHPDGNRPFENRLTVGGAVHWRDVDEQRRMAVDGGLVWTRQYDHTTPVVYQWKNLILWGMGPPLGLLCLFGVFFGVLRPIHRPCWKEWVVWAWVIPNLATTMFFHTKFPRYLIAQAPFYCLWGAALGVWAYTLLRKQWEDGGRRGLKWHGAIAGLALATVVWSALFSFAFVEIYRKDHPWMVAADWFDKEVPAGKRIITESWDDSVPWGGVAARYQQLSVNPVHSDDPQHLAGIARQMASADYYCFSSKRNYGAFLQSPEDSPNRCLFVKSLFAGHLGYRLVKTFSEPVYVLGIPIRYELADESLSLYDHPTMHIFERVERIPAQEIIERMSNPPEWIRELSREQILTHDENRSILAPRATYAVHLWVFGLIALGWLFWPITFTLFRGARDGGLFASKMVAILLFTYLLWFGASVGWWTNAPWASALVLVAWTAASILCLRKSMPAMAEFLRAHWKLAVFSEVLFLLVFNYFFGIRASNPDIHWGEKSMDISFVNAAYKNPTFPAVDPWFAGRHINYYYYGHAVVGLFGKSVGVPPEYAYNLAAGSWPALVFVLVFGLVLNLTNSKLGGLLGAFLATMAGTGKSFIQIAANLRAPGGPIEPKLFRENYVPHDGLSGYFADVWEQLRAAFSLTGDVFGHVWLAFRAAYDPELVEQARQADLSRLLGFDDYLWKLSRIVRSSVACEFPAWTATFADLHAHFLIMPIGVLALSLMTAYILRRAEVWRLKSADIRLECFDCGGGPWVSRAQIAVIGLLLGMVSITNRWDFPGLLLFFAGGVLVLFAFHCRDYFAATRETLGRAIHDLNLWGRKLEKLTAWKFFLLAEVLLPLIVVWGLSYAFFYPFHLSFEIPQRVKGTGWMAEAGCGWVTPYEYFQIFGFLTVIVGVGLVTLYGRWIRSTQGAGIKMGCWAAGSILLSLAMAWLLRGQARGTFDPAGLDSIPAKTNELAYWRYLDSDIAYVVCGFVLALFLLFVPFMLRRGVTLKDRLGAGILGLGLAIIAGIEVVYVVEGWGPPGHRWNTIFKFHLQAWICLSIGCGWLMALWLEKPVDLAPAPARALARLCRYTLGYPLLMGALAFSALFPMVAPYIYSQGNGVDFRSRQVKGVRTADGLNYLRVKEPDAAAAIDWLRAKTDGVPTILEGSEIDSSYRDDRARYSSNTGLPTLIGWVHHSRERDNKPEPRLEDARTVFTSFQREKVRDVLRAHNVRYVVLGQVERTLYGLDEGRELEKFDQWSDLFRPVFRSKIKPPGVTLYAVDPDYRLEADFKEKAVEQPSLFVKDSGQPLLRGSEGFAPGQYKEPRAIVFSKSGQAFVADTMNHRIQSFDERGNFQWWVGEQGEEQGFFKEPNDLTIDENGTLYVLDTWNSRVQIFSPTGEIAKVISMSAFGPRGIAVGQAPIGEVTGEGKVILPATPTLSGKLIYLANTGAKNLMIFDPSGK
ncbi:MAG: glycosyltransferase family 39 protein, partial [Candidatus Omnitrophica bacterium]|nr:glycosyltransferase family 39 protein [Candidatus Omnitrophota bacterium]